jgi:NTP pyrophosphatase (non-canonical NTP hydrolase)
MNPFRDQEKFMKACDQSVEGFNADQFNMYLKLIEEEADELGEAIKNHDQLETLDVAVKKLVNGIIFRGVIYV